MNRKRMMTVGIVLSSVVLIVAAGLAARPKDQVQKPKQVLQQTQGHTQRPVVEVVFALDTTGSMSGLIEGAKAKIWSIASHIASGQPMPELRVGLVAYRDRGDAYVTRVFPLNADLDAVFEQLMSYHADGGGDTPEHVNQALHDAVHQMAWSPKSMKMVFLVGDAPPQTYQDGPRFETIAKDASAKGIVVHTVRCGGDSQTGAAWQKIASLTQGSFSTIDQSGGVLALATPMDGRFAELNKRLNNTALIYGDADKQAAFSGKAARSEKAPASTAADRASYYAKASPAKLDATDVLGAVAGGTMKLEELDDAMLPEEMQLLDTEGRKGYVAKKQKEREAIVKELAKLSTERDAFLKGEAKKAGASGFDEVVKDSIREQGAKNGIAW